MHWALWLDSASARAHFLLAVALSVPTESFSIGGAVIAAERALALAAVSPCHDVYASLLADLRARKTDHDSKAVPTPHAPGTVTLQDSGGHPIDLRDYTLAMLGNVAVCIGLHSRMDIAQAAEDAAGAGPACAVCAASATERALMRCARCREVLYCGKSCQRAHWA